MSCVSVAKEAGHDQVVSLLGELKRDPLQTRSTCKREFNMLGLKTIGLFV